MTDSSKNQTLKEWLDAATDDLQAVGISSARLDAELLASYGVDQPRTWLHAHPEHQLTKPEYKQLKLALQRRLSHEPIAYILGRKEFYGQDFIVTPAVLVPRPESEAFFEILKQLPANLSCLDIGTGSGALAITAALLQPSWRVTGVDISRSALTVAQRNARLLNARQVVFRKQNLLAKDHEDYDVLMANLPYVPKNVCDAVDISHEPKIALDGGLDGLDIYRDFFASIKIRKSKPRYILTESLAEQHRSMATMGQSAGYSLRQTIGLVQLFCLDDFASPVGKDENNDHDSHH